MATARKTAAKTAARKTPAKKTAAAPRARGLVTPAAPPPSAPRGLVSPTAPPPSAPRSLAKKPTAAPPPAPVAKKAKPAKKEEPALVRDGFTMPAADFALIAKLKGRALLGQRAAKKSELLRAGLHALAALDTAALVAALDRLVPVKTGRPKKHR